MDRQYWAPLVVGLLASFVALSGYLMNQAANRRERKAKLFAEALEAIKGLEEIPFRIARRPASDGPTRAAVGDVFSDLLVRLGLYRASMQIEAPTVAVAYTLLLDQTHRQVQPLRRAAWAAPLMSTDAAAYLDGVFPVVDNQPEWGLCLAVMRAELRSFPFLHRRRTSRLVSRFQAARTGAGSPMRVRWRDSPDHGDTPTEGGPPAPL